jgi:hypothetical protein
MIFMGLLVSDSRVNVDLLDTSSTYIYIFSILAVYLLLLNFNTALHVACMPGKVPLVEAKLKHTNIDIDIRCRVARHPSLLPLNTLMQLCSKSWRRKMHQNNCNAQE